MTRQLTLSNRGSKKMYNIMGTLPCTFRHPWDNVTALCWAQLNFQFWPLWLQNRKNTTPWHLKLFMYGNKLYTCEFPPIPLSSFIWNYHLKFLMSHFTWFRSSENYIIFPTFSSGPKEGVQHIESSLALPMWRSLCQEKWCHCGGSTATESIVVYWRQLEWRDYRLAGQT